MKVENKGLCEIRKITDRYAHSLMNLSLSFPCVLDLWMSLRSVNFPAIFKNYCQKIIRIVIIPNSKIPDIEYEITELILIPFKLICQKIFQPTWLERGILHGLKDGLARELQPLLDKCKSDDFGRLQVDHSEFIKLHVEMYSTLSKIIAREHA